MQGLAPILAFFLAHWVLCVFCQTFFLHRYGAHRMFTMSKGWERFFHLLTYAAQGSSYSEPAWLRDSAPPASRLQRHREGSALADQLLERVHDDAPHQASLRRVRLSSARNPEPRFVGGTPEWPLLDRIGQSWVARVGWGAVYTLFYLHFATAWWMFLLLPLHYVMGPIHGAIVNWCGHRYGYQNFENGDESRNTLPIDILTGGELFQNNHHKFGMSPNFAVRKFELDPCYQVMRLLAALRIIDFGERPQQTRFPAARAAS